MSLHQTLSGAYRAMRKHLLKAYDEERDHHLMYGGYKWRGDKYLRWEWWGIEKIDVQE